MIQHIRLSDDILLLAASGETSGEVSLAATGETSGEVSLVDLVACAILKLSLFE